MKKGGGPVAGKGALWQGPLALVQRDQGLAKGGVIVLRKKSLSSGRSILRRGGLGKRENRCRAAGKRTPVPVKGKTAMPVHTRKTKQLAESRHDLLGRRDVYPSREKEKG